MPLIVVVEQEKRYIERIEQALSPQGWEIQGVADRAAAMQKASDAEVALLVVNSEVGEAAELVESFSRGNGGPGVVLLVPESSKEDTSGLGADEVLHKPFTDQEISLAVRRCVSAAQSSGAAVAEPVAAAVDDGVQLTSEDIFGDVVLELQDAFNLATADAAAPAEEAAAEVEEAVAAEEPEAEPEAEEEAAQEEAVPEPPVEEAQVEETSESTEVEIEAALDSLEEVAEEEAAEEEFEEEVEAEEEAEPEVEEAAEEQAEEADAADEVEEPAEEEAAEAEQSTELEGVDEAEEADEATEVEEVEEAEETVEEEPAVAAVPSKLDQALGSMRAKTVAIDDEFSRPAEVTDAEIDAMVRSAIVGPAKAARQAPAGSTPQASSGDAEAEVAFEEAGAEPVEDYEESEEGDEAAPEGRSSKKWLWVVVLLALAALLIFVISNAQGQSKSQSDPAVVSEEVEAQPVEPVESNGDDE